MSSTVQPPPRHRRATARLVLHTAPVALLFGAVAAALVYGAARGLGVSMLVPVDARDPASAVVHVGLTGVLLSSVFPAFAGAIALALLTRTTRPVAAFVALAAVLLGLAVKPLLFPGADPAMLRIDAATRHALASIHVVRIAAVVWTLVRAFTAPRDVASR